MLERQRAERLAEMIERKKEGELAKIEKARLEELERIKHEQEIEMKRRELAERIRLDNEKAALSLPKVNEDDEVPKKRKEKRKMADSTG